MNESLSKLTCVKPSKFASLRFAHQHEGFSSPVRVEEVESLRKRAFSLVRSLSLTFVYLKSTLQLLFPLFRPTLLSGILMDPMWNIYDKLLGQNPNQPH